MCILYTEASVFLFSSTEDAVELAQEILKL